MIFSILGNGDIVFSVLHQFVSVKIRHYSEYFLMVYEEKGHSVTMVQGKAK